MENKMYTREAYFYPLPEVLIAQEPLVCRDQARLLVVDRASGRMHHDTFNHVNTYLPSRSHLIANNSKVMPARLLGSRASGGAVEVFLLNPVAKDSTWEVLLRPLKKIRQGEIIDFGHGITGVLEDKEKRWMRFNTKNLLRSLKNIGHIPLPPYIKRPDRPQDHADYQTVYAKSLGSVASPTAGLHFTKDLIKDLKQEGHRFSALTLHINYGTFKPVEALDIRQHPMHTERYRVTPRLWASVLRAKEQSQAVVAIGTTSCRVLESVACSNTLEGSTDIFIYPGYVFQTVDVLITNFHLPYSTLLMLVCAFGGYDLMMRAYQEAVNQRYRFYSYGDAMLIL